MGDWFLNRWLGYLSTWLGGREETGTIQRARLALDAAWATTQQGLFWLILGCVAIVVLVAVFYVKGQGQGAPRARHVLAIFRSLLLICLLLTLAQPVVEVTTVYDQPVTLFVVFDGTGSMQIRDRYEPRRFGGLEAATGLQNHEDSAAPLPSRLDYVRAWLRRSDNNTLLQLREKTSCRMRFFIFDGAVTSNLRELDSQPTDKDDTPPLQHMATELTATGQVTALGDVLRQLAWQSGRGSLAGILLVSDFAHNTGENPGGSSNTQIVSPIKSLDVPIYALGVGAESVPDLAIELMAEPKIRRGEKTVLRIRLREQDVEDTEVKLVVRSRALDSEDVQQPWRTITERNVEIGGGSRIIEVPFVPAWEGDVQLEGSTDVLPNEIVTENNVAQARVRVVDDFVRLLYVADEPTWEWRFFKEVLHRDPAVGVRGFRTYLVSSDPRVRQSNPLFQNTLAPDRKTFFAHDMVILDDLSRATLTDRFCEMVHEFVGELGGGLVVLAGPSQGLGGLVGTAIEEMLPVRVDPQAKLRDQEEFVPRRVPQAERFAFMQLGDSPAETEQAWQNMGRLPWYHPVTAVDQRAVVLAEHPEDYCRDGKTPQPLIAVRRYGKGEVIYLAFNEMWRLRRETGEKYYRRFWLPMIDRLALSHALGPSKRFVPRLDRETYDINQDVILSVQAYDQDYQPLEAEMVSGGALQAELVELGQAGEETTKQRLEVDAKRPGLFETRFPVRRAGRYEIRIEDPLSEVVHAQSFEVVGTNIEMSSARLDIATQETLAQASGGHAYRLENIDELLDDARLEPEPDIRQHRYPIWSTPAWFVMIVVLMLSEWGVRKWVRLA